jgi:SPP1 family predicted phage head-tail adaptor
MPVIGPFNRRVVFERKAVAQDETGHEVETWTAARTAMAHRRDVQANERLRASQEIATRTSVFTVRWFSALNAGDWRISHDGLIWDVIGLAEPPNTRRQYWAITATAGGA